jgi:nucleotide-binding universal stress UspA family protein
MLAARRAQLRDEWVAAVADDGVRVRTEVVEGDPRFRLLAVAQDEDADLIVIGRSGRGGGPGFLHLGSVAEHVAHHTWLPLAVIPEQTMGGVHRIVVGADGSHSADAAIAWCGDVAHASGAEVIAVAIEEPLLEWTPSTSPQNWRRDAERQVARSTAALTERGIPVDVVARSGLHPADGLLEVAAERQADLLVIGTRGMGGFPDLRVGGVTMKVVHRSGLPLVLVPIREE